MAGLLREGEEVTFGSRGNFSLWAGMGWSPDGGESEITWIEGFQGTLEFSMIEARGGRSLSFSALPAAGDRPHQMFVYLNGRFVSLVSAAVFKEVVVPLPPDFFRGGAEINVLSFVCPTAAVPAEIGRGSDLRTLGFAFRSLSIAAAGPDGGAATGIPAMRPRPPFRRT